MRDECFRENPAALLECFFPDFFSKWSFYDRPFFYFKVSSDLKLDVASCVFFLKNKEKSMSTSVE